MKTETWRGFIEVGKITGDLGAGEDSEFWHGGSGDVASSGTSCVLTMRVRRAVIPA